MNTESRHLRGGGRQAAALTALRHRSFVIWKATLEHDGEYALAVGGAIAEEGQKRAERVHAQKRRVLRDLLFEETHGTVGVRVLDALIQLSYERRGFSALATTHLRLTHWLNAG